MSHKSTVVDCIRPQSSREISMRRQNFPVARVTSFSFCGFASALALTRSRRPSLVRRSTRRGPNYEGGRGPDAYAVRDPLVGNMADVLARAPVINWALCPCRESPFGGRLPRPDPHLRSMQVMEQRVAYNSWEGLTWPRTPATSRLLPTSEARRRRTRQGPRQPTR